MDKKAFENNPVGRLICTPHHYHAYVPALLPEVLKLIDVDSALLRLIADAERTLGRLDGIGYSVLNPDFLVIPYTRLEAVASSRIEGTQASLSELFYFEAASERPPRINDLVEVQNYLTALNHGLQRLDTLPLSLRLVRELHEHLMTGARGGTPDKTPGEFRRSQNWIGPPGCSLENATYVPPPPDELMALLDDWEKFIHDQSVPMLVQCALLHYQFEAIHPFLDGNGRVGRLWITLFLYARKALSQPLLYLSAYFEKYRDEYYNRLLAFSQRGDWRGWLEFFMQGVLVQSEHAIESAKRIIDQREHYRRLLQQQRVPGSVLTLLDHIFRNPYLSARQIVEKTGLSFATVQKAIQTLEDSGILEEVTGKKRNRVYVARELLQLLVENEPVFHPTRST